MDFDCDGHSEAGPVRDHNEDAWTRVARAGLVAVCDGMGGHDAGDYASGHIVERLQELESCRHHGDEIRAICGCLVACNQHLISHARSLGLGVIGSTAVILHLGFRRATVLWVGDSRAYRLRNHALRQVTRDHVPDYERPDVSGVANAGAERSGAITRAVGADPRLQIDRLCLDVEPGDVWLLCSDGVSTALTGKQITTFLEADFPQSRDLVHEAIRCGSTDNCTAVIVRINSPT